MSAITPWAWTIWSRAVFRAMEKLQRSGSVPDAWVASAMAIRIT
ncbi:hypothetical protein [Streptomyces sp. BE133]|nr:hypothetical protein [Streptomyces sp. BE133]MEE1811469.1 hypothetical protein [Streptomyces sp. BE133]